MPSLLIGGQALFWTQGDPKALSPMLLQRLTIDLCKIDLFMVQYIQRFSNLPLTRMVTFPIVPYLAHLRAKCGKSSISLHFD